MRSFLGIEIPENMKKRCVSIQKSLQNRGFDIKFVEKENLHWTVKFLGDLTEKEVRKSEEIVKKIVKTFEPFKIKAQGIGVFPNFSYIKTVWVDISKNKTSFKSLIEKIDEELERKGFRKEKHEITPHLTLGRVKSGKNKKKLRKTLENMKNVKVGEMEINEITLYKSKLTPKGPIYKRISGFSLGE